MSFILIGGKVKNKVLKSVLKNGYDDKLNDIDNYRVDKDLSGKRVQVYHNPDTNHTIINHRGTKGLNDVYTDLKLMMNFKNNKRFQHGKDITDKAINKYSNSDVSITGHSLGHKIAEEANLKHNKEQITLNGAITPYDLIKKQKDNEFHIRSEYDPISVLHGLNPMKNNNNNTTIKGKNLNLLNEHKTDVLGRLDDDLEFGK